MFSAHELIDGCLIFCFFFLSLICPNKLGVICVPNIIILDIIGYKELLRRPDKYAILSYKVRNSIRVAL